MARGIAAPVNAVVLQPQRRVLAVGYLPVNHVERLARARAASLCRYGFGALNPVKSKRLTHVFGRLRRGQGRVVKDQIDFRTTSGERLRFVLSRTGQPLPRQSGNFLYARGEDAGLQVLFVGETDDLATHAQERWAEAEQTFGPSGLYTRLNITAAQRRRELDELVSVYAPPMNATELRRAG